MASNHRSPRRGVCPRPDERGLLQNPLPAMALSDPPGTASWICLAVDHISIFSRWFSSPSVQLPWYFLLWPPGGIATGEGQFPEDLFPERSGRRHPSGTDGVDDSPLLWRRDCRGFSGSFWDYCGVCDDRSRCRDLYLWTDPGQNHLLPLFRNCRFPVFHPGTF